MKINNIKSVDKIIIHDSEGKGVYDPDYGEVITYYVRTSPDTFEVTYDTTSTKFSICGACGSFTRVEWSDKLRLLVCSDCAEHSELETISEADLIQLLGDITETDEIWVEVK